MYYYSWREPPLPGPGSYATHPAHDIFHGILTVVTAINLILQAYNFYLMLRVARTQLNEYRYFMMLSAIILVYTFDVNLIGSQVYSMVYRVTAVLTNASIKRRFLSSPVVAGFQLLMLAASAGLSCAIHIATVRDTDELYDGRHISAEGTRNAAGETIYIHRKLWHVFLHLMKETEYITEDDTSIMCFNSFDWTSRYIQGGIVVLFLLIEALSSSAAFWTIRRVGRLSSQSQAARRMHVQLTRLLLLQMMCPLICMVGPLLYFVISVMLFPASIVGAYMGLVIIAVFPMVNAVLTITFVGPYRRYTVGWLKAAAKGDLRTMSSTQASSAMSSPLVEEVPAQRQSTVFGTRRNHIYPLPVPPTPA